MHISMLYENEWANILAKNLVTTTKASGTMSDAYQVFLASSGTEANEAAFKFARNFAKMDPSGEKFEIIAFTNAFHGRSLGSLSATYNPKYRDPFGPLVPGFKHGTFNSIEGLDSLITDKTCAVIVEPLQGEGGIIPAKPEFLAALRKRCDETRALLIIDEVQSGVGRTGSLWAHAHPSLRDPKTGKVVAEPDILTSAKGLGNGFPVGATIVTRRVAETVSVGIHGTTYGGNPVASRIASHVLDRVSQKDFLKQVDAKSQHLIKGLKNLQAQVPNVIKDVRGKGLMIGVELEPALSDRVPGVIRAARERGLLIIVAGSCIRIVPPLTIEVKDLDKGLEIFKRALQDLCL